MHYRLPHPGQGILGLAPAIYSSQPTTLPSAFSIILSQDPTWHTNTCASSHLNLNASNLSTIFYKRLFPSVHVGDGKSIPVTNTGHRIIPSHHRPLHLHNVLVTPNLIKNLISVRQITRDNNCTIEFDAFGFFVKDYLTRHILIRCDSSGNLYPSTKPSTSPIAYLSTSASIWHQRLGRPVYMHQPPGFVDNRYPHHVCLLQRSLYGLKQAPRAWFQRFTGYATRAGFYHSRCDSLLFIYRQGSQVAYLLIYVDVIILTASCPALLQQIIGSLNNKFDMTDLGAFNYFLGISAEHTPTSFFLSQKKYALQLLERAHMVTCKPSRTPIDTESKLGSEGVPVQDLTLYHSLAGGLQEPHFATLKRILRYVRGTVDFGIQLYVSATTSLVSYTDADCAGCPSTRRSTSGYCVFLGDNILSWSAKRQHTISCSSAEAEYRCVANVVAETVWIHNLLRELHSPLSTATLVYYDNVSAVYMSVNHVQHQQTKHIEIDIHFICDMVTAGHVRVLHVLSRFQYADIFTKGLLTTLFEDFPSSLSVRPPPAQTARAY
ncbi:ribonuclease H-like domain-containing protein [Tanacetum coccineum]